MRLLQTEHYFDLVHYNLAEEVCVLGKHTGSRTCGNKLLDAPDVLVQTLQICWTRRYKPWTRPGLTCVICRGAMRLLQMGHLFDLVHYNLAEEVRVLATSVLRGGARTRRFIPLVGVKWSCLRINE